MATVAYRDSNGIFCISYNFTSVDQGYMSPCGGYLLKNTEGLSIPDYPEWVKEHDLQDHTENGIAYFECMEARLDTHELYMSTGKMPVYTFE